MPARGSGKNGAKTRNEKGYVRLYTQPHRGKYEHRVVMSERCREFCYYPLADDGLPVGFTVEHIDHNRTHNCGENLMLLQDIIHNHLSAWSRWYSPFRRYDGSVDWVKVVGVADEVPW